MYRSLYCAQPTNTSQQDDEYENKRQRRRRRRRRIGGGGGGRGEEWEGVGEMEGWHSAMRMVWRAQ